VIAAHRRENGTWLHPVDFLENRFQALIPKYYATGRSPLPCTALATSCFIDANRNLYPCSIWSKRVGNLREGDLDLRSLWEGALRRELRERVVDERCPHCWTPCEAYPTILDHLARAALPAPDPDKG
jgi:MoaA/NifB/PqqE/SkfB family radical SAM enzyme